MRRHWCPTKQIAEESKALHVLSRRTYYDIFDGILTDWEWKTSFFFRLTAAVCSSAFSSAAKEWFHRIYIYNKAPLARWHGHVMPVDVAKKCYPRWPKKIFLSCNMDRSWFAWSMLGVLPFCFFLFFRHIYSCGFSEGPEKAMNHKDVTLKQGNWKTCSLDIHIIHPCCLNSPLLLQMPIWQGP